MCLILQFVGEELNLKGQPSLSCWRADRAVSQDRLERSPLHQQPAELFREEHTVLHVLVSVGSGFVP